MCISKKIIYIGGIDMVILNRKIIDFVEELTDGQVTCHASESDFIVLKMNTLYSLKELIPAIENEFPCVEFDFPVDKSYIIVYWK